MKKIIIALLIMLMAFPVNVKAEDYLKVKATAYCYNSGTTATGTVPMEGRTLAGKREWFGKTAIVYFDEGNGIESKNYLGTFIVEDTGGEPIQQGYVIDVFIEDYDEAIQFGSRDVIVVLVDAEG